MDAAKEHVQSSGVPEEDDRKADDLMWWPIKEESNEVDEDLGCVRAAQLGTLTVVL